MILIHDLIRLYILVFFATALLSWFPTTSSGGLATVKHVLAVVTEPVLRPLRQIMPRPNVGGVGIDLSVMIAILMLIVLNQIIP